ncbi:uncharacterized protein LOC108207825 [Daucus carota subsp. sativus]|uniref:uncharacterized protein LOC108207825 n=1 Tax=Daucus carota subsp. sativus TaxID=79200 RepID=UPI0007EFE0B1|nr:PREDICTED: uncharacterized protein LOC108207825 [Daucus carota subsp. sativus]
MGPPTVTQRLEQLEEKANEVETTMAEMAATVVDRAIEAMRLSLTELIREHQTLAATKLGADFETLASRLEGRLNRSREHQETLINTIRTDQLKFQDEVKSTLAGLVASSGSGHGRVEGSGTAGGPVLGSGVGHAQGSVVTTGRLGGGYSGGFQGGGLGGGQTNWRYRKLDMPIFDGEDPDGWILRVERYFAFYKLTEDEMLEAVAVAMDGDALRWYQWENKRRPIRRWEDLKTFILRQFRSVSGGSLYEQWLSTTQSTTVKEYRRAFIETAAPLDRISEDILMGHFVNGLKEDIKAEVRVLNPLNLEQAMELAVRIEEKQRVTNSRKPNLSFIKTSAAVSSAKGLSGVGSYVAPLASTPGTIRSWGPASPESQGSVQSPQSVVSSKRSGEVKRLTEKELQEKRAKGLCYRCDDKWVMGHRCKRRELSVLLIDDEEEDLTSEDSEIVPSPPTEPVPEVSLNSVVGLSNPKTMKLRGIIGANQVVVLIDPGATHNFLSLKVVEAGGIVVTPSGNFGVSLGNGEAVRGTGLCKEVCVQLDGGLEVVEDFLPLELGSTDVILGVQWLEKLGEVMTNWKTQVMRFEKGGELVTLVGDPSLVRTKISLKAMYKTLKKSGGGYLIECQAVEKGSLQGNKHQMASHIPEFLRPLITQYQKVFDSPKGLPPSRGHEHSIVLKAGSDPVGVRPYRYPQNQKDEIERLITEMLAAGIIRPSTSPFSSPVLLVKKKDGSWRFCVDYRALNRETVPDKYPIPVIDELLDELHGAKIFTKLDLKSGYHQILVKAEDTHKTAFRTHDGHYEFLVMPFGLMNAPATFQALMNDLFRPLLRKTVLVFFDDILVYSRNPEEHYSHVATVLEILRTSSLYANLGKCEFGQTTLGYLGHVISDAGVEMDLDKVRAMTDWPRPRNLKELRGFLGLTGYYRKFIAAYAEIARPLTEQLRKDNFGWSSEATAAFEALKAAMTQAPVLAMPNFEELFVIETDASGYGLGAVLMQKNRPLAFYSKLLGVKAQQKSIYEKE